MFADRTGRRRRLSRLDNLLRHVVHAVGRVVFVALVAFHAWLFCAHVIEGRILEPQTAGRWVVAVLVLVGFRRLSRLGLPLAAGRRAIVLWVLVLLLHAHAVSAGGAASVELGIPETLGALAQITGSVSVLGALLVVLLATLLRLRLDGRAAPAAPVVLAGLPSPGFVFSFAPRPPPLS
jgi:hypothetical protein